jgi:4a-hydroxytetrahydrobiopterin dehydratase
MRLVELMDGYFKPTVNQFEGKLEEACNNFSGWQEVDSPKRLIRDYTFTSRQATLEFLRQLFLFEDELNHHGKVTVEYDQVRVEVYTRDINTVTELDSDYATVADQIYLDVSEYE